MNSFHMRPAARWAIAAASFAIGAVVQAGAPSSGAEKVHAELVKVLPNLKVDDVRAAPVAGLFEVSFSNGTAYATPDGKYLIHGDLFEVPTRTNLTEKSRGEQRLAEIAKLDGREMILFSPEKTKHTITVLTDVDCGYCRKLHSEIAKLNELGIAVRYVAFPRTGPGSESWTTMEAVWCSKDRKDAITRAKLGEKIAKPASCTTEVVAKHFEAGARLATQGTPTIILEDGSVIAGYLPPDQLVQRLDAMGVKQTTAAVGN